MFIREAIHQNDTPNVSRVLLFDTVLCMTRGKLIQYASRRKKARNARLHKLEDIICNMSNAGINDEQFQSAVEGRDEIIKTKTCSHAKLTGQHTPKKALLISFL